jgi:hypothetical protein
VTVDCFCMKSYVEFHMSSFWVLYEAVIPPDINYLLSSSKLNILN